MIVDMRRVVAGDARGREESREEFGAGVAQLIQDKRGARQLCEDGEQPRAGRGLQDEVRTVRQRLYREFCRPQLTHENAARMFADKRPAIEELYRTFPFYAEPSHAEDAIEFFEGFWEVIADAEEFEDEVLGECTPMPR